jgi:hypothetical protein
VIYRGHIIAEYKNMLDMTNIYGDRKGVRTFWTYHIYSSLVHFQKNAKPKTWIHHCSNEKSKTQNQRHGFVPASRQRIKQKIENMVHHCFNLKNKTQN